MVPWSFIRVETWRIYDFFKPDNIQIVVSLDGIDRF